MESTAESAGNTTTYRGRLRALTTVMAIIAGAVAIGLPASPVVAAGDGSNRAVTITTYGARNLPQGGVTVKVQKVGDSTPFGTCTTNVSGQCTISGLSNSDYYAEETAATSPYNTIANVWTGNNDGTNGSVNPYRQTFAVPNNSTVGVSLFTRRDNPAFPARCGLKLALVIDTSGSTSGSQPAYKSAAKGFVDALAGTPSSVGVWSFATTAANQIGLTSVSNSTAIKTAIDSIPASSGYTNWDAGIYQVANVGADVVVVITDGNPTSNSGVAPLAGGTSGTVRVADVEGGAWAANSVKANGAKVVVFGIGSGFTDATNMKQISGPNVSDDYYLANNVSGLDGLLSQLASKTCGGTVTVQKQLQSTPNGAFVNTAGWNYAPAITSGGGSIVSTPADGKTAGQDGLVNFAFSDGTWPKTVTVTETMQFGNALQKQGDAAKGLDRNAVCTANGAPLTVTDSGLLGVSFTLNKLAIVNCVFKNVKFGTIIINKATTGGTGTFAFTGSVAGSITTTTTNGAASGTPLTASVAPGTYNVAETPLAGWDTTSSCSNGSTIGAISVGAGETVTCTFQNVKRGTIIIKKATTGTTGTFAFTGTVNGSITTTTSNGVASGNELSQSVVPGTYSVAETPVTDWDTTSTCSDGSAVSAINVSAGETVTCTFFNVKKGSIVIKKATLGDVGTFAFGGALSGSITTTSSNGQPSGPVLTKNVAPGTYAVTETAVPGWDTTSSCDNGSSVTSIVVSANQTVTCTFVNTKRGALVVKKATVGATGKFDFTGAVAGSITTTTSNGVVSGGQLSATMVPGTYVVAETPVVGWDTTSSCDNASPVSAVVVPPGRTVTCTFVNTKRGTLIVKKATVGSTGTFEFTGAANGSITTSTTDGTISGTSLSSSLAPGTYVVAETPVVGWDTTASCDNASPVSAVVVPAGQTVSCTFVNTKRGAIVVRKASSGATGTFSFTGTVAGDITTLTSDGVASGNALTASVVPGADYSVAENLPAGWGQTSATCSDGSPVTKIDVAANETVICTFTNVKHGSITIVKVASPQLADDFSFTSSTLGNFSLDDDGDNANALSNTKVFADLQPGTYDVQELASAGWTLQGAVCSDSNSTVDGSTASIVLNPAEDVVCTFTNHAASASIIVNKTSVGGDGAFNFTLHGAGDINLPLTTIHGFGTTGNVALVPGTSYTISENDPGMAWITGQLTCTVLHAGAQSAVAEPLHFTVLPGDAITCSMTNTKKGTVIIVKNVSGANGTFDFSGTFTDPADFQITTTGDDQGGAGSQTFNNVPAGTYTVDELNVPANYDGTLSCADATGAKSTVDGLTGTIRLDAGDTVTCTYTNTERGTIVVDKVTTPSGDPTEFGFTLSDSPDFALADQTDAHVVGSLIPGNEYTLTELAHDGWDFTDAKCASANGSSQIGQNAATATINLGAGDTVTCTYANSELGPVTVDKVLTSAPTLVSGNTYSVSYDVIVHSGSYVDENFDLVDALDFGAGASYISETATGPDGITLVDGWNGVGANTMLVDQGTIGAQQTLAFSVIVTFDVEPDMFVAARGCESPNGTGTLNNATVTVRGQSNSDSACGEIPNPDLTIIKTVSSGPVRDSNGLWTIAYDLNVTNTSAAGPGFYELDDALQFGSGVTIQSVSASAVTDGLATANPSFNGLDDQLVAANTIEPGGSHVYRVTVTATAAVSAAGAGDCDLAANESGTGFLNSASILIEGNTVGQDMVCRPYSTLTLVKNLINDGGGNSTLDQFVLSARAGESAPIISGPDPDASLDTGIGAAVPAGAYALAETTLPGYEASNWGCTGGTVEGNVVTVPEGSDVVCVVTNDDRPVDLQLTKSDGGATPVAGGSTFDYTLTIDNVGTRDADLGEPVLVTDRLPVGLTFVSVPSNCSIGGQTLTCLLDSADLEVSDPAIVLTITVNAAADAPSGTYTNMAYVTTADDPACDGAGCVPPCAAEQAPNMANNTDCVDTPVTRNATISVTKTDSVDAPVVVGDSYHYTIVVTNNGPSTVTNVSLSDDLPAGLALVGATGNGWTCNNLTTLRCTWIGQLAAGASTPALTVNVTLATASPGSQVVNTAFAQALVDDKGTPDTSDDLVAAANDNEVTDVAPLVSSEAPQVLPPATFDPTETLPLPRTGSESTRLLNLAAALLCAGIVLMQVVRRRRAG